MSVTDFLLQHQVQQLQLRVLMATKLEIYVIWPFQEKGVKEVSNPSPSLKSEHPLPTNTVTRTKRENWLMKPFPHTAAQPEHAASTVSQQVRQHPCVLSTHAALCVSNRALSPQAPLAPCSFCIPGSCYSPAESPGRMGKPM